MVCGATLRLHYDFRHSQQQMSKAETGWPRNKQELGLLPSIFEANSFNFCHQLLGKKTTTIHFSIKISFCFHILALPALDGNNISKESPSIFQAGGRGF